MFVWDVSQNGPAGLYRVVTVRRCPVGSAGSSPGGRDGTPVRSRGRRRLGGRGMGHPLALQRLGSSDRSIVDWSARAPVCPRGPEDKMIRLADMNIWAGARHRFVQNAVKGNPNGFEPRRDPRYDTGR